MAKRKVHIPFVEESEIYNPTDIEKVLEMSVNETMTIGNNKGVYYYNIPCSFDIETTSCYRDNNVIFDYEEKIKREEKYPNYECEKVAIMYIWQFGINGRVIVGRTWQEFIEMIDKISDILQLHEKKRLMIYVHNLAYEFQFMCKWFDWENIFSIDVRKPIYAITSNWIEFRCSYLESGYSLAKLPEQLLRYTKASKMVGDLDYSLIRNSKTKLTDKEIKYCVNDVRVVMAYIQEKIENERGIQNLQITKTGYTRQYCKKNTLYLQGSHKRNMKYFKKIHELNIKDMKEFNLLQRAFAGGFTHANAHHVGDVKENVGSFDFTSSYPYVMVSEKFPMSRGVHVELKTKQDFFTYMSDYLCVFDVKFVNIMNIQPHETPISVSKCYAKSNVVENNGRLVCADEIRLSITNIDFDIYKQFYSWDEMEISNLYVYTKDYLPTELVKCILELYQNKTTLKNVEGKEIEYLKSKEMINSVYGMCVTNPMRDEYLFTGDEWQTIESNPVELFDMLEKHNESNNRFLYYIWGVFVTAYARRNLFTGILALQDDYIYSDTDSIKCTNKEKHKDYFQVYNKMVDIKLETICQYHKIDFEMVKPKTIEGKEKKLGIWDYEGTYKHFKTLGAKRYMIHEDNAIKINDIRYPISITVSGVNKFKAIPYIYDILADKDIEKAFEYFTDNLYIPPEHTGKMLHTYIDYEQSGYITDYQNNTVFFQELSSTHLEPTSFTMSLPSLFIDYVTGVKDSIL